MKLDFTNIREFRDAFSSGKISKDAISTEGSLSIRGKKYAVKVIGGDTCTENQKCYCPPPIFIAAHAGKNRWPSSVKEFFTHRLANFSTKSQKKLLTKTF